MFKRGVTYSRKEIGIILRPDNPPHGGNWATGYDRIGNNLIVFMNIGIPGRTGHDFANYYDPETQTLIWYGKPRSHSGQPTFQKLMDGSLKPLFFARWNDSDPFTFLGTGSIVSFKDGVVTDQGHECIQVRLVVQDIKNIITEMAPQSYEFHDMPSLLQDEDNSTSFVFEKHLEDFLVKNWRNLPLANQYDIYEEKGNMIGQQYRTSIGPIDILGINKSKSDFLIMELKRDRASDHVVGQTLRYMGWVKEHLCKPSQTVSGCIIAHAHDEKLKYALKEVPNIRFMKYEVDFRLTG